MNSGKLTCKGRVKITLNGRMEEPPPDEGMTERTRETDDNAVGIEERMHTAEYRKIGAPPKAYLFSVVGVAMVFAVAIIALFRFWEQNPDGMPDEMVLRQWENAHPIWSHFLALAGAMFIVAACDVHWWMFSAWIAQWRYRENITVRRVAFWRLGVQIAFATVVIALFALFPNAFPRPNGHFPNLLFVLLGIPVIFAALYLHRASRNPMPQET